MQHRLPLLLLLLLLDISVRKKAAPATGAAFS